MMCEGVHALPVAWLNSPAAPTASDDTLPEPLPTNSTTDVIDRPGGHWLRAGAVEGASGAPPRTEDEFEVVQARLLSLGLRAVEAGGGGNCFFCSLAAQLPELLHSPNHFHLHARKTVVDYMYAHADEMRDFLPLRADEDFESYLTRMGTANEWVEGETEVWAAACAYNVNIYIYTVDQQHDKIVRPSLQLQGVQTRSIAMAHYSEWHFQPIVRLAGQ